MTRRLGQQDRELIATVAGNELWCRQRRRQTHRHGTQVFPRDLRVAPRPAAAEHHHPVVAHSDHHAYTDADSPKVLRDAHYPGAKKLGHGTGYVYPHDDPQGFDVDHLPEELKGKRYYEPESGGEH